MNFELDNTLPVYIQLVEQIRICIISGQLQAGERLPSVREWALQVRVNPNTMQKALAELEEEGLIYTQRTNGKFVTENTELIERHRQHHAAALTARFAADMKKLGFDGEQLADILKTYGGTTL